MGAALFPGESHEKGGLPSQFEIENYLADSLVALSDHLRNPLERDIRIGAYRTALIDMLESRDETLIRALLTIKDFNPSLRANPDIPAIFATNLYLRYLQKHLISEKDVWPGADYPLEFTEPEVWKNAVKAVAEYDEHNAVLMLCSAWSLQSNVADRYKSVKYLLHAVGNRFTAQPRLLDVGCSQNIGLKAIAGNIPFFSDTQVRDESNQLLPLEDSRVRQLADALVLPAPFGPSHGVDIFTPEDPHVASWIRSCSFYPSELLDTQRVAHFDRLVEFSSPDVGFIWNDFANPVDMTAARINSRLPNPGDVDVAVLSTLLYQLASRERRQVVDRAFDLLSENGLLVVQDFVHVDDERPWELDFSPWQRRAGPAGIMDPYPYKTYVWDKADSKAGFKLLMEWTSGRCDTVRLNPEPL